MMDGPSYLLIIYIIFMKIAIVDTCPSHFGVKGSRVIFHFKRREHTKRASIIKQMTDTFVVIKHSCHFVMQLVRSTTRLANATRNVINLSLLNPLSAPSKLSISVNYTQFEAVYRILSSLGSLVYRRSNRSIPWLPSLRRSL
jgi:hypothetical protein